MTTLALPRTEPGAATLPCDTCADKPCLSACPAGAVRGIDAFNIPACLDFRLAHKSVCAERCLSRLACPYFPEHRYSQEQVQYHYRRSLETTRLYLNGE